MFGSEDAAAMFGRFSYKSAVLSKVVTSPFAAFARIAKGRCTYLQFMEDMFATAASVRWIFRSDPGGGDLAI